MLFPTNLSLYQRFRIDHDLEQKQEPPANDLNRFRNSLGILSRHDFNRPHLGRGSSSILTTAIFSGVPTPRRSKASSNFFKANEQASPLAFLLLLVRISLCPAQRFLGARQTEGGGFPSLSLASVGLEVLLVSSRGQGRCWEPPQKRMRDANPHRTMKPTRPYKPSFSPVIPR